MDGSFLSWHYARKLEQSKKRIGEEKIILMKEFIIKRSFLGNLPRKLVIHEDCFEFQSKNSLVRIDKDSILGIKYGIHFIKGLEFYIGRDYQIIFVLNNGKEFKINFKTFYKYKLNEKHQLYKEIIDAVWDFFISDLVMNLYYKFNENLSFNILNINFENKKILLNKKWLNIEEVEIKSYYDKFIIYEIENPENSSHLLFYLKDTNAVVLWSLLNRLKK